MSQGIGAAAIGTKLLILNELLDQVSGIIKAGVVPAIGGVISFKAYLPLSQRLHSAWYRWYRN